MKPWEENWYPTQFASVAHFGEFAGQWYVYRDDGDDESTQLAGYHAPALSEEQVRFIVAAPAMCRALLAVEWSVTPFADHGYSCRACDGAKEHGHEPGCTLDAALTAAGLPDKASRDAARATLAEAKGTR